MTSRAVQQFEGAMDLAVDAETQFRSVALAYRPTISGVQSVSPIAQQAEMELRRLETVAIDATEEALHCYRLVERFDRNPHVEQSVRSLRNTLPLGDDDLLIRVGFTIELIRQVVAHAKELDHLSATGVTQIRISMTNSLRQELGDSMRQAKVKAGVLDGTVDRRFEDILETGLAPPELGPAALGRSLPPLTQSDDA